MFYEKRPVGKTPDDKRTDSYWEMFFPQSTWADRFIMVAAIVGFVVAVQRRQRGAVWLGLVGSTFGVWAYLWPQSLLWNARLLPFMYLCRYMLAAYGIYVLVAYLVGAIRPTFSTDGRRIAMLGVGTLTAIVTIGWQSFHLWDLPGGAQRYDDAKKRWVYEFPDWPGPKFTGNDNAKGFVTQWASWDFEGYEKKKAYGEYHDIVATMKSIGEERGCGRAVWENNNDQDKYGTPMALMLLPFWTDGCIGSMEGLFFEAAGTTPFHFMTASAVSDHSSNPVRRLQYEDRQLNRGVEFMKTLGVRYYLAYNDAVTEQADKHEGLTLLRQSGPWKVYELVDSTLVVPLKTQPIVVPGVGTDRDKWLEVGMSWFQHQADWDAVPVAGGPPQWQRVGVRVTSDKPTTDSNLAVVFPDNAIERTELAPVAVSNVRTGDNFISFDVDKIGVPVMVKVSAFPNWKASGATGPWRAAPNFMVVVPTSTTVRLNYGFTGVDLGSHAITFAALGSLIVLWRRRPPDLPVLVGEGDVEPLSDADEADEEFVEVGQPVADGESARVHVESGWLPPPPTPSEGYDR